jgi:sulfopropanediol 3-dehydrogenase
MFAMARVYLKKSSKTASTGSDDVRATVMEILNEIEAGGDAAALKFSAKFDGYDGNLILTTPETRYSICSCQCETLRRSAA